MAKAAVTVRAPAKVNLQLSVGALRPDGYHDLVTVFQAVGLYDDITASKGSADGPGESGITVSVEGEGAGQVPLDGSNLAVRAVHALAELAGVSPDVHLHLRKGIPVAGGMAGGSADAAGALVACDALWGLRLDRAELHDIAAGLGADVPFSLVGGTAVGVGTGSSLTPALAREVCERTSSAAVPSPTVDCPPPRCTPSSTGCTPRPSGPSRGCPTS